MYRRKPGDNIPQAPVSGGASGIPSSKTTPKLVRKSHGSDARSLSPPVLLTIGCILLFGAIILLNILSPASVQLAEKEFYKIEGDVRQEVEGMLGVTHEHHPGQSSQRREQSIDATTAMLQQGSSWVDGEKKLKAKLKLLAARQEQGKDLGVPVLTRWLGEDIPAWAGEGVDVEEWRKKVDAKYDEMREEENQWRMKMAQFMEQNSK